MKFHARYAKAICLSALTLIGWLLVAHAQAMYWLYNGRVSVFAPVYDADGLPLSTARYVAELWGGPAPDSLTPAVASWTRERVIVPFGTGGVFIDRNPNDRGYSTVFTAPPLGWSWLQVRAWDTQLGATYEEVLARGLGGYGESPLFYAQGGDPNDQFPLPAPLTGLQSFSLRAVVPEPAPWVLLALGGLGLWWVARRRQNSRS